MFNTQHGKVDYPNELVCHIIFYHFTGIVTLFNQPSLHESILESPEYLIETSNACVYIEYMGDVSRMSLKAMYHDSSKDVLLQDTYFIPSSSWRPASVKVAYYYNSNINFRIGVYQTVNLSYFFYKIENLIA